MIRRPGDTFVQLVRNDAGDVLDSRSQVLGVLVAPLRILFQTLDLRKSHGGLVFGHPAVGADDGVAAGILDTSVGPAAVVERHDSLHEFFVVSYHGAAFADGQMFGVLEAEASEVADSAELLASPLGHPRSEE